MPNKKISQLPQANLPLTGAELLALVQDGVTMKASLADIQSRLNSVVAYPKHADLNASHIGLTVMADTNETAPFPVDTNDSAQWITYLSGVETRAKLMNPMPQAVGLKGEMKITLPFVAEPKYERIKVEFLATPVDGDTLTITDTTNLNSITITYTDTPIDNHVLLTGRTAQQIAEDTVAILMSGVPILWAEAPTYGPAYEWFEVDLCLGAPQDGFQHPTTSVASEPLRLAITQVQAKTSNMIFDLANNLRAKALETSPYTVIAHYNWGGTTGALIRTDDLFLVAKGNPNGSPGTTTYFSDMLFYASVANYASGVQWAMENCNASGTNYSSEFPSTFAVTLATDVGSNAEVEFELIYAPYLPYTLTIEQGISVTDYNMSLAVIVEPTRSIEHHVSNRILGELIGISGNYAIINTAESQTLQLSADAIVTTPPVPQVYGNGGDQLFMYTMLDPWGTLIPWKDGTWIDMGGLTQYYNGNPQAEEITNSITYLHAISSSLYQALAQATTGETVLARKQTGLGLFFFAGGQGFILA